MELMGIGHGSAPGKVIITGEHSVVYGYPAIAASIGLRCHVQATRYSDGISIEAGDIDCEFNYSKEDIDSINNGTMVFEQLDSIALSVSKTLGSIEPNVHIKIASDIPISAGLGSSAAVAVASIAATSDLFDIKLTKNQISEIAFEAEKITHGTPSGIDNSITTFGGILKFQKGRISVKKLLNPIPLIIGNTLTPRNTKKLVKGVSDLKNDHPQIISEILDTMGKLANTIETALEESDLPLLGELFNINHGLLDSLGVGHPTLSELVWRMRVEGALGAKLTGAGGGGCIIAVCDIDKRKDIANQLKDVDIIATELSSDGVILGKQS